MHTVAHKVLKLNEQIVLFSIDKKNVRFYIIRTADTERGEQMVLNAEAGKTMARIRKERKMTQAELGAAVGVTQRMIAAIEAAERRPSPDLAQRIGAELGLDWNDFYTGGKDNGAS